jgi:hypothetical protein
MGRLFRVQGSGFRVQGIEFRVWGMGRLFRIQGLGYRVEDLGPKFHHFLKNWRHTTCELLEYRP